MEKEEGALGKIARYDTGELSEDTVGLEGPSKFGHFDFMNEMERGEEINDLDDLEHELLASSIAAAEARRSSWQNVMIFWMERFLVMG